MLRRDSAILGLSALLLSLAMGACNDGESPLEVEPLRSVEIDNEDCDPYAAVTECEEAPPMISHTARFLDYNDNEEPRDFSLHEPPGDPTPWAPGVWLGPSVTPEACDGGPDADRDGFSDSCEYAIARSFAPLMQFTMGEQRIEHFDGAIRSCARGEPHWAVKRHPAREFVSIAYMPAYYVDCGDAGVDKMNTYLKFYSWWGPQIPNFHWGDSELIRITVEYNRDTRHWQFHEAFLSAHHGTETQASAWLSPTEVEFAGGAGTFPKVWVARNKHANYVSKSACERGAAYFDDCDMAAVTAPYYQNRFPVRPHRNVGSPAKPLVYLSYSEFLPSNRYECFYACGRKFRGWIPTSVSGDPAGSYRDLLFAEDVFEDHVLQDSADPGHEDGDQGCEAETAVRACDDGEAFVRR